LKSFKAVRLFLAADLLRYDGAGSTKFLRHFLFTPGYKYTVWMRLCGWSRMSLLTRYLLYPILKLMMIRCRYKYGIAIPEYTEIGPGLFINRFGGIYVNGDAIIGSNVNIGQHTLMGQANRGARMGSPIIGDRVSIAFGAAIVGRINIGEDSIVGLNAVVTKDVPPSSVLGGVPAKVLSDKGSAGYVNRLVPPEMIERCHQANR
jgi:serine O-acetyltransferase